MELLQGRGSCGGTPVVAAQLSFFVIWIPVALLPVIIAGIVAPTTATRGCPTGSGCRYRCCWSCWSSCSTSCAAATFYQVTNQRLRVRRGILARDEQTTRFERVQNVNISQSMMDRLMRVGAVDFDTAGTAETSSQFRFAGIADPQGLVRIVGENTMSHGEHTAQGIDPPSSGDQSARRGVDASGARPFRPGARPCRRPPRPPAVVAAKPKPPRPARPAAVRAPRPRRGWSSSRRCRTPRPGPRRASSPGPAAGVRARGPARRGAGDLPRPDGPHRRGQPRRPGQPGRPTEALPLAA